MDKKSLQIDKKKEIVEKHFDMIYRLALSQVKNREHAEDVVQEVFLRFLKFDKSFESDEHIKAWLLRVAVNCCHNVFSSSWHKKTVPLEYAAEEIVFDTTEKSDVYYAVADLPQKYRVVVHLFYYEDMSIEDISKYLGANPSTVKSQLSRGRKLLEKNLKGRYDFV